MMQSEFDEEDKKLPINAAISDIQLPNLLDDELNVLIGMKMKEELDKRVKATIENSLQCSSSHLSGTILTAWAAESIEQVKNVNIKNTLIKMYEDILKE